MVRVCNKCEKELDIEQFSLRGEGGEKRSNTCKGCVKIRNRQHYQNNKNDYLERNRRYSYKWSRMNHKRNWEHLAKYLSTHPCVDCGIRDIEVLQFDHVRGEKTACVSTMMYRRNWDVILEEIAKCEVRCANCHIKKTNQQFGYYRLISDSELKSLIESDDNSNSNS